jgi:hypothetical protein
MVGKISPPIIEDGCKQLIDTKQTVKEDIKRWPTGLKGCNSAIE